MSAFTAHLTRFLALDAAVALNHRRSSFSACFPLQVQAHFVLVAVPLSLSSVNAALRTARRSCRLRMPHFLTAAGEPPVLEFQVTVCRLVKFQLGFESLVVRLMIGVIFFFFCGSRPVEFLMRYASHSSSSKRGLRDCFPLPI